jgi:SAM-dependent methyltransferase
MVRGDTVTYRAKKHYQDPAVAAVYDAERFDDVKGRFVDRREQALIRDAIRASGISPSASVLDLPCGTGRLTRSLVEAGFDVTGVDVSPAMLERAAARTADLSMDQKPKLVVGDAAALPFDDDSFDLVVSLRLFGHLPPPTRMAALREIRRVGQGPAVLGYYHRGSLQRLRRQGGRRGTPWFPVSLSELDSELTQAGFVRARRRFLMPFVSETVIVLARPTPRL